MTLVVVAGEAEEVEEVEVTIMAAKLLHLEEVMEAAALQHSGAVMLHPVEEEHIKTEAMTLDVTLVTVDTVLTQQSPSFVLTLTTLVEQRQTYSHEPVANLLQGLRHLKHPHNMGDDLQQDLELRGPSLVHMRSWLT